MKKTPSSSHVSDGRGADPKVISNFALQTSNFEKEDHQRGEVVEIAVCLPVQGTFHYRLPAGLKDILGPGWRVLVPFGKRVVAGFILAFCHEPQRDELREVLEPLDDMPLLPPGLFPFFQWVSDYYMCPLGEVFHTALAVGARVAVERTIRLTEKGKALLDEGDPDERRRGVLLEIQRVGEATLKKLTRHVAGEGALSGLVKEMEREGLLLIESSVRAAGLRHLRRKALRFIHWPGPEQPPLTPRQTRFLAYTRDKGVVFLKELRSKLGLTASSLRRLVRDGFVAEEWMEESRGPLACDGFQQAPPSVLTSHQDAAVEAVQEALEGESFAAFLLHGVTGSGKTEVYIRAAARAVEQGRGVLVLVPEISLTPQLLGRFCSRFGEKVALLHSALGPAERYHQWRRILKGEAPLIIGARSAIFAPLVKLGLIVVDEEHDSSFKQEDRLRYNARDLALVRARMEGAVVILGSATPSMESMANIYRGKIRRLALPRRIADRPLPPITVVDMRDELVPSGEPRMFSSLLREAVDKTLTEGNQAMLFLNRRGFAHFLLCLDCGHPLQCPNCSITLTYHKGPAALRCHYCGHGIPIPQFCPQCASIRLRSIGAGTQKVVEEISRLFPKGRVARMDRDTTRGRGSHGRILELLALGKVDILVGTQMIAKGHDFPGVTLVGVLLADLSLNFPDFRAAERTFQILTQVSGRAGRGDRPGQVIIQTYNPEHYSIMAARDHDIDGFYQQEFLQREGLKYPPAGHLILLRLAGNDPGRVEAAAICAGRLAAKLASPGKVQILGPAPAPLARLKGKYRWNLLLKSPGREPLRSLARQLMASLPRGAPLSGISLAVDVDPQNFM